MWELPNPSLGVDVSGADFQKEMDKVTTNTRTCGSYAKKMPV